MSAQGNLTDLIMASVRLLNLCFVLALADLNGRLVVFQAFGCSGRVRRGAGRALTWPVLNFVDLYLSPQFFLSGMRLSELCLGSVPLRSALNQILNRGSLEPSVTTSSGSGYAVAAVAMADSGGFWQSDTRAFSGGVVDVFSFEFLEITGEC